MILFNCMRDEKKFKLLTAVSLAVCVLAVLYNVASEYIIPDMESYIQRKLYYERVISKKGLSLHRAQYWREEK